VRFSLRGLAQNWRLKLAALALAVLLWAVVSAEQPASQWIPVRVDAVVEDPDYVLAGGPDPAEVLVQFTGPGRELWRLAVERPTLELRIRDVGNARSFAVDPAMVTLRERLQVEARNVRPAVVRVPLQRLATRAVPVRVRIGERSLARYVLNDTVRVGPSTVRLTGPEDELSRIESVPTLSFEIVPDQNDSTFAKVVALDTAGLGGISLAPRQVRVSGSVDRREERVIPDAPVWVPQGTGATPGRVEVRVLGSRRALIGLTPTSLRATVPRGSLPAQIPAGGAEAEVVVENLPPGTTATVVPARVRVAPLPAAAPAPASPSTGGTP
jgi:YbbR domain-containing protein